MTDGRGRRGIGVVLPVVMMLFFILLLGAVAQLFHTGSALTQATRDAGGAVAEQLAESAIEEALWHFQELVNDPSAEALAHSNRENLFNRVRKALIVGEKDVLDITDECAPVILKAHLSKSEHSPFYRHLEIESFSVKLRIPCRGATERIDTDNDSVCLGEQFIDIDCAVSLKLRDIVIWRRVCVRRRYGMAFISNYKPFDQLTFAILQSDFLAEYPDVLQKTSEIIDNVNRASWFLGNFRSQLLSGQPRINLQPSFIPIGKPPEITGEARSDLNEEMDRLRRRNPDFDQQLARMDEEQEGWYLWSLVAGKPSTRINRPRPDNWVSFQQEWPFIPSNALVVDIPTADSVIFSVDRKVNLEDFDYDKILVEVYKPLLERIKHAAEIYNDAVAPLLGTNDDPVSTGQVRRLEYNHKRAGRELSEALTEAIKALNDISGHLKKHSRAGFTTSVLGAYLRECSSRIRPIAYHINTKDDLKRLRERLPTFNGHASYHGKEDLHLNFNPWSGKTIFSCAYHHEGAPRIIVDSIVMASKSRDFFVLNAQNIHLRGDDVEASIFAADRVHFRGDVSIYGNLLISHLRLRQDRDRDEDLKGTVLFNPRCYSGVYWKRPLDKKGKTRVSRNMFEKVSLNHYTVGLLPRGMKRVIFRSAAAAGQPFDEAGEADN